MRKYSNKNPPKAALTLNQLKAARNCAVSGLDLLTSFLRHDDWDSEMTKKQRNKHLRSDRQFIRVIKMLETAIRKVE